MIDIKQYLHYYMGCEFWTDNSQGQINSETLRFIYAMIDSGKKVQLIVRRLDNLTDKENKELGKAALNVFTGNISYNAEQFHYLLSRGFWLFGDEAFEQGVVIDAETLKEK